MDIKPHSDSRVSLVGVKFESTSFRKLLHSVTCVHDTFILLQRQYPEAPLDPADKHLKRTRLNVIVPQIASNQPEDLPIKVDDHSTTYKVCIIMPKREKCN